MEAIRSSITSRGPWPALLRATLYCLRLIYRTLTLHVGEGGRGEEEDSGDDARGNQLRWDRDRAMSLSPRPA